MRSPNIAVRAIRLASGYDWWHSSTYPSGENLPQSNSEAAIVVRHLISCRKQDKEIGFTLYGSIVIWGTATFAWWCAKKGPLCCVHSSGLRDILFGLLPVGSLLHEQSELLQRLQPKQDDRDRLIELRKMYLLAKSDSRRFEDIIEVLELRGGNREILDILQSYVWEVRRITMGLTASALGSMILVFMLGEGVSLSFCHIWDNTPEAIATTWVLVIASCWVQAAISRLRMARIERRLNEAYGRV